jgi:hypothetical protein
VPRTRDTNTSRFAHWRTVVSVTLVLAVIAAGCDWFNKPVEVNLLPLVRIVSCPDAGELVEGDDVTFEWLSEDLDGEVDGFEWSLGDSLGETTANSETFTDLAAGDYEFVVTAFDEEGGESLPDTCSFTVGAAGGLVERTVLCEMLTTKSCINCWKAELALERMVEEFGGDRLTVISYHYFTPPLDPVGTQETIDRCDWYYTYENFDGLWGTYPVTIFDGLDYEDDAPDTTSTKIAFRSRIEGRLEVGSPVSIAMEGDLSSARGEVTVTVRVHEQLTGGSPTLRMVVIEDEVWDGEEYFEFVARDILDEEALTVSAAGDSAVVTRGFSIGTWNPQHLDVIALVQDDSTAEIIQSARLSTQ